MNNKIIFSAILVLALIGVGIFSITSVKAQTTNNPASSLVTLIANKFGLKQTDVQSVFDQHQADRQAEMESRYQAMLDQAVKDGKLTENQKGLVIQKRQELKSWASQNNIDLKYLYGGFGHGREGMRGMMGNFPPNY